MVNTRSEPIRTGVFNETFCFFIRNRPAFVHMKAIPQLIYQFVPLNEGGVLQLAKTGVIKEEFTATIDPKAIENVRHSNW